MSRRDAAAVVILILTCAVLAGCTPKDLMGLRATADGLEFIACEPVSTQAIKVWVSPVDSETSDYTLVWESTGDTSISAGGIVEYGVDLPGMATDLGPLPIDYQESIVAISFENLDASGQLEDEIQAHFTGTDIPSEDWLDESGGHSSEPCR